MDSDHPQTSTGDLLAAARARFPSPALTQAEFLVLSAIPKGTFALCGPSGQGSDPSNSPRNAAGWPPERQIRADLLAWLCTDPDVGKHIHAKGIQIRGAQLKDGLDLAYATLNFSLVLQDCIVSALNLANARLQELDLSGSSIRQSFFGYNLGVTGSVFLIGGFHAVCEIDLHAARIGGDLNFQGGAFLNLPTKAKQNGGYAIQAERIAVGGSVLLAQGFRAEGEVYLVNARIGDLRCEGARFVNPRQDGIGSSGSALTLSGASAGVVVLSDGCIVQGTTNLVGTHLRQLNCSTGTFIGVPVGAKEQWDFPAMTAYEADVELSAFLGQGFSGTGIVNLTSLHVGVEFNLAGADLSAAALALTDASTTTLIDDGATWPAPGKLLLDGFKYEHIKYSSTDAKIRLDWLALQPSTPFSTLPYLQLAKFLRSIGDLDGAVMVSEEMERRRRSGPNDSTLSQAESWILDTSIGYGFDPGKAVWEILGLSAIGWIIYRRSYLAGAIVPTDAEAYSAFKTDRRLPEHYPTFAPLIYSIENSLPLIKLGQVGRWQPDPAKPTLSTSSVLRRVIASFADWRQELQRLKEARPDPKALLGFVAHLTSSPRLVQGFLWIQIVLGWLLATLFVGGVTGLIRKD